MLRWFLTGWFCLIITTVAAEEMLLGLPAPRDAQKPGAIMLHGGGSISDDTFERFIALAGGKNARIVLVPSAGYRVGDYRTERELREALYRRFGSWSSLARTGRIQDFQFLYTDDPRAADDEAFIKPLETATGVWFSGGYQSRLNYRYVGVFPQQTKFQNALREIVARGGIVGGTSVGTAIMPEIITMMDEREHETAPATAVTAHGFGLLTRAIVEQHFDARGGRLERFAGLLRDHTRLDELADRPHAGEHMSGIAVEERTAFIAQGNRVEVLGRGHAHLFLKSNAGRTITWHELVPGDTLQLVRDVQGRGVALREQVQVSASAPQD
jgi:cyanophycinase